MTCGIYLIQNKKTQQKYIGQSNNIERRWKEHVYKKDIKNSRIEYAIKKYGKNNFNFIIIEILPNDKDILNTREQYWIKYYNTYNDKNHYNLTPGGKFSPMTNKDICKKVSITKKGTPLSEEHKNKLSKAHKNKKLSKSHRNNISIALKKTLLSQKLRKQRSINTTGLKNPSAKYTMWDIKYCRFFRSKMYNKKIFNPCKCFGFYFNGKRVIGDFIDFYTPELIGNLVKEFTISSNP